MTKAHWLKMAAGLERVKCHTWAWELFIAYVICHNNTGQLSVTKKNVIFLLSERAFY